MHMCMLFVHEPVHVVRKDSDLCSARELKA